ncbi:OLC1v1016474C1, partial [Oldenlandia corymbosa var. corymbosa]
GPCLLKDGRKLLGTLRSFNKFANSVFEDTYVRVIAGNRYCDIPLGLYVIRGETLVLIGELGTDKEELPSHMTHVLPLEIRSAEKAERDASDPKGTKAKRIEFPNMDD